MVLGSTGGQLRQGSENPLLWPELWGLRGGGNPGPQLSPGSGSLRAQAGLCQPQGVRAFLGGVSPDRPPLPPAGPELCLQTVWRPTPVSALGQDSFRGAGGLGGPSHCPSETRLWGGGRLPAGWGGWVMGAGRNLCHVIWPSLGTTQGWLVGTAAQWGHETLRRAGSRPWLDLRGFLEPWALGHPRQVLLRGAQRLQ